jgi:organic hydroperoxide reductase OsmC/OhrA
MKLKPKKYKFSTKTKWTQARKGVLSADGKSPIKIGCPPEFGGEPGYWTAEHLFISSIEICIMTTFMWLLEKMKCELISYDSEAIGTAQMVNGDFRFNEIEVKPVITVPDNCLSKAKDAIEGAYKQCLISKSLNLKVHLNPIIKTV